MTVLCSICSKHSLIPEGPLLPTLKFVTEIKDTNNSSAEKYVAKISLRPLLQGGWMHGRTDSEKKSVIFFSFLVGKISFHCPEHSNEIKFLKKWEEKRKKREIQINKERKLRIKSEITVIIFAVDKGKTRL